MSSYFSTFNYVNYPDFLDESGNTFKILKKITNRVIRKQNIIDDKSVYYKVTMTEGETIESISNRLYGSPVYYWTIMIINNRLDRFYDFPLNYGEFEEYIVEKYGSIAIAKTTYKFYVREDYSKYSDDSKLDKSYFLEVPEVDFLTKYVQDPSSGDYISVQIPFTQNGRVMKYSKSFYDIEVEQNEEKRNVLVIDRKYLDTFVQTFQELISR